MARTRIDEDFDRKKGAIVEAALGILLEEGIEKLGINYLLQKTNMSKGAFFHYFASKEALLAEVLDYASKPIIEGVRSVLEQKGMGAAKKLIMLYQQVASTKADYGKGLEVFAKLLFRGDNRFFLMGVMDRTFDACLPLFEQLISEGLESGDFHVDSPRAAAYHILTITIRLNREIGEFLLSEKKREEKKTLVEKITLAERIIRSILNCDALASLYQKTMLKRIGVL